MSKGHWTQTPEGRKRMSEIAKKAALAPGAKKRMSELAKRSHAARRATPHPAHWGAHRVDIPDQTRTEIARRYANGAKGVELAREYGVSTTTIRDWAKRYGKGANGRYGGAKRNGLRPSNRARTMTMQACGACRTCLLCQKLGAEPQWIMCLVANPLDGGVV